MSFWKYAKPQRSSRPDVIPQRFARGPNRPQPSPSLNPSHEPAGGTSAGHGRSYAHTHGRGSERVIPENPTADVTSPDDIIIAVMGITGSGKTTFISRCMGEAVGIGHDLHSFTQDVAIHSFQQNSRTIRLIDTPGFDDTAKSDVNILNNIAFWLSHAYRAEPKLLLNGIIYLHPISETKMVGTATKNLTMMKRLCGEQSLGVVWLATTMWGLVPPERGLAREQELISTDHFWGGLRRHGSHICRHQDSDVSAFAIIDHVVAQRQKVVLSIQRQMVDEHRDVDQTDAGKFLRRKVLQEQEKVRDRLDRSAQELEEQIEAQNTAEVEEVLERQRGYHQKLEERSRSLAAMRLDMDKLREQKAQEFAEREKEFEREKATQDAKRAELDKQINDLRVPRDKAVKRADEDAEARRKLEDANLHHLLQEDLAAIANIDRAIVDRMREEQRAQLARQQIVKQESTFKRTMKVSMADSLVHGAFQVAGHIVHAMCTVM